MLIAVLTYLLRYANMDYIFLSALQSGESNQPSHLLLSYDISCQWYKNLKTRVNTIPQHIRLNISSICTRFLVPKFHLPAHVPACHSLFSFNYTPGAGHTDGESIERDWAMINPVSYSTHEMSPGHRQDTLNDHWGDCNWHKTGFSTYIFSLEYNNDVDYLQVMLLLRRSELVFPSVSPTMNTFKRCVRTFRQTSYRSGRIW